MPAYTGDVLLQTAALARPTVELVAAAHGDHQLVLEALETSAREGVVELADSNVRFTHPLLASICYEQAPVWKRRAVHRVLADVVTDAEQRARHRALGADGPDERIAVELDGGADQAAARGAPGAAAELCSLAADLTPDDPARAGARRLRAANLYILAGRRDEAIALLEQLLAEGVTGVERADVLIALVSTFRGDTSMLIARCDEALACASGDDIRSARILAIRILMHLLKGNVRASLADARAALEKAERADDPVLLAAVIARVAQVEVWAAEVTPGLLERGVEIEERLGLDLDYSNSPRVYMPRLLMRLGEIDRARTLLEEVDARAVARGHEYTHMNRLWYLAMAEWLAGRWQRALEHAAAAHEVTEQIAGARIGFAGRFKALVETDLGLVEQARASTEEGLAHAAGVLERTLRHRRARCARPSRATRSATCGGRDHLRELPGRLLAGGLNDPSQPVWADAIETLVALGELEQAGAYLEPYELHASRLGSPLAMEGALRCRGLLRAAEGDMPAPSPPSSAPRPSSPSRPSPSSAAARCSVWGRCAGRRSRRGRRGRRSSRRSRSSRSSARGCGPRRLTRS